MKLHSSALFALAAAAVVDAAAAGHHIHKRNAGVYTQIVTMTAATVYEDVDATTTVTSVDAAANTDTLQAKNIAFLGTDGAVQYKKSYTQTIGMATGGVSTGVDATTTLSSSDSGSSTSTSTSADTSASSTSTVAIDGDLADYSNPTKKFKDGTIKCSEFPSGQGVIALPWIGRNGWASVTNPSTGDTATECKEGWLCSYACQAGMSKTQWPESQPSSGESRGGLTCKNGYLYRTRTSTDYLCEWGNDSAYAVSKVSKVISLCRTDYPGSENMNIPTRLLPGTKKPMSVVNEDTYYQWEGKMTSAQYYVNDLGVDVEEGCQWGTSAGTIGNWAPVVLGVGYTDSKTWMSVIPNPNNKTPPKYNVKLVAADSKSTISGSCSYINGAYNGAGTDGCTVAVSGTGQFLFY